MSVIITPSMEKLAKQMKRHAQNGLYEGRSNTVYFEGARREHAETMTMLIYTRDIGMHTCGWFKNPEYDRCYHLSVSFWDFTIGKARPFESKLARTWVSLFYGERVRYLWEESPYLPHLPAEVRHYRVMCNPAWQPIIPRGEVYTRDFIEKGWLSWSDQYGETRLK